MKWLVDLLLYSTVVITAMLVAFMVVFRYRFVIPWRKHEAERHDVICTRLDSRIEEAESISRSYAQNGKLAKNPAEESRRG